MSFPRYDEYKDSGVEWLGEVPMDWKTLRLKRQGRLLTEKTSRGNRPGNRPLGLENVEGWTGRFVDTETDFEGDGVEFEAGDLLFGKLRPYLAKVYLADVPGEAVGDFHVIRVAEGLVPRFAQYQMLTPEFIAIVDGGTFGSKMPRASWESVGNMVFAVPPVIEQHMIASFLDTETSKIDALVSEQRRLIELLKEKRQAVISHAVTKGLDPNVKMKPSGIEWLGDVPEHWAVTKMKWVAKMESGHTPDKKIEAYWTNCKIPWVSLHDTSYLKDNDYITDTAHFVNELGIANSSARLLPPRAVVFSRDATIGRCAITTREMAVSQHFIAWLCGRSIVPEFLLYRLRSMTQ